MLSSWSVKFAQNLDYSTFVIASRDAWGIALPRELIGQSAGNPGLIGDTCEPVVACDDELYL